MVLNIFFAVSLTKIAIFMTFHRKFPVFHMKFVFSLIKTLCLITVVIRIQLIIIFSI